MEGGPAVSPRSERSTPDTFAVAGQISGMLAGLALILGLLPSGATWPLVRVSVPLTLAGLLMSAVGFKSRNRDSALIGLLLCSSCLVAQLALFWLFLTFTRAD